LKVKNWSDKSRVFERIVEAIRHYIASEGLLPGRRLPPERVLIEQLDVSRSSLREALRVLSTMGLVEIRRGDGIYVASPAPLWNTASTAFFDATEENALRNLVEARLGVESALARAATERGSEEDFDRLEQFLDGQEAAVERNPELAWEPLGFELQLAEIAGNPVLLEIEQLLAELWRSLSPGILYTVGHYREWLTEHRAILASMRSRNAMQVQRLVLAHVNVDRFERDLQQRPRQPRAAVGGRE
jgi:GntR family transcriptional repressor for pyruvate dehydrogenase complex